jgi:hypothetical protein
LDDGDDQLAGLTRSADLLLHERGGRSSLSEEDDHRVRPFNGRDDLVGDVDAGLRVVFGEVKVDAERVQMLAEQLDCGPSFIE